MKCSYPIALDLVGRRILVVGAGRVALRKVQGLLAAGADDITIVALEFHPDMPATPRQVRRAFSPSDIQGVSLCFAATDIAEVNRQVVAECRQRGVWVNRADHDGCCPGDFAVPAVHRAGSLTIAVSAGESPRVAAMVRDDIAATLDPLRVAFAQVAGTIRARLHQLSHLDQLARRAIVDDLVSAGGFEAFRVAGADGLWSYLVAHHEKLLKESVP